MPTAEAMKDKGKTAGKRKAAGKAAGCSSERKKKKKRLNNENEDDSKDGSKEDAAVGLAKQVEFLSTQVAQCVLARSAAKLISCVQNEPGCQWTRCSLIVR
jgi:hypothetical protein